MEINFQLILTLKIFTYEKVNFFGLVVAFSAIC